MFCASLLRKADVLVENFVPGTLEKMGFDWDTLKDAESAADRDAHLRLRSERSAVAQALLRRHRADHERAHGHHRRTGRASHHGRHLCRGLLDRTVRRPSARSAHCRRAAAPVSDRSSTWRCWIPRMSMLMTAIPEQMLLGRTMTRRGNRDRYGAPANTFPTSDGAWVHLAVAGDPMFRALVRMLWDSASWPTIRASRTTAREWRMWRNWKSSSRSGPQH